MSIKFYELEWMNLYTLWDIDMGPIIIEKKNCDILKC